MPLPGPLRLSSLALATSLCFLTGSPTPAADTVSDEQISAALKTAGKNRTEIQRAIDDVTTDQRNGMRFLVAYMPERDLKSLTAKFLIEQTDYAYRAWRESAWTDQVPESVFFNAVLPYASINERRDAWRGPFRDQFTPLIQDAKTAGEAATMLNNQVFRMV
ncbi:MAG: hypothetical protein MK004_14435, partial [Planctomycetales bacterium]|nr:hypothetical protein [Planctomycetales bacterium]